MNLKTYLEHLSLLVKENPEALLLEVITANDDEGNGFTPVHYSPSLGGYDADDNEFDTEKPNNAVCLN
jgi:hypothetical protein